MEPTGWQVQVFFDGDCPLCRREINLLKKLDRHHHVWFTDIAAESFNAADWGISFETLMDQMHVRLRNGRWESGVEAFRQLYRAVGFGWLIPCTRLPGIKQLLDVGYRMFAKNRLKWTGRCNPTKGCAIPARPAVPPNKTHLS